MSRKNMFFIIGLLVSALILWGCSTSEESQKDESSAPPPNAEKKAERMTPPAPARQETTKTEAPAEVKTQPEKQTETAPSTQPAVSTGMPTGDFSVQIGAFTMSDKAEQVAALARYRFIKTNVYAVKDANTGNTKILVGDFTSKDEARKFRDQIMQQFPDDYKGAWVFEVPHK